MNYKERLKQYLEEDAIYNEYKSGRYDMSDFDKFCIEHCKDIESLLNENERLKKKYEALFDEFINYMGKKDFAKKCNISRPYLDKLLKTGMTRKDIYDYCLTRNILKEVRNILKEVE